MRCFVMREMETCAAASVVFSSAGCSGRKRKQRCMIAHKPHSMQCCPRFLVISRFHFVRQRITALHNHKMTLFICHSHLVWRLLPAKLLMTRSRLRLRPGESTANKPILILDAVTGALGKQVPNISSQTIICSDCQCTPRSATERTRRARCDRT